MCNRQRHLWQYAKRLYQIPAFQNNIHFDAIVKHYNLSANLSSSDNPYDIVPKISDVSVWNS